MPHNRSGDSARDIVHTLPVGIMIHTPGPGGRVVYANEAMSRFLGAEEPGELDGMPVATILYDPVEWEDLIKECVRSHGASEVEVRFRHRAGACVWGGVCARAVYDEAGRVVELHSVVRDITREVRLKISKESDEEVRRAYYRIIENLKEKLQRLSRRLLAAQEQERKRLAMELHDGMGQALGAIKMVLERQVLRCKGCENFEARRMEEAVEMLIGLSRDLHHIIFDLRPPLLDDLGLKATLQWYLEQFASRHSIRWDLEFSIDEGELPVEYPIVIYRITQEALTNVGRHSGASRVRVSLARKDDKILLVIEDDGVGFDLEKVDTGPNTSYGLTSMSQRAELVGGRCRYDTAPGHGTRVEVWLPRLPLHPEAAYLRP